MAVYNIGQLDSAGFLFKRKASVAKVKQTGANAVVTSLTELQKLMEEVAEALTHSITYERAQQKKKCRNLEALKQKSSTAGFVLFGPVSVFKEGLAALGTSGSNSAIQNKGDVVAKFEKTTKH